MSPENAASRCSSSTVAARTAANPNIPNATCITPPSAPAAPRRRWCPMDRSPTPSSRPLAPGHLSPASGTASPSWPTGAGPSDTAAPGRRPRSAPARSDARSSSRPAWRASRGPLEELPRDARQAGRDVLLASLRAGADRGRRPGAAVSEGPAPVGHEGLALPEAGESGPGARGLEEGAGDRSIGHHRRRGAAGAEGGVMHVAFGMLGFAAVLAATVLLEQREAAFSGLIYRPALLLLCAGPLFISLISHKLEELAICARTGFKAMRFSATRSRAMLHEELSRFVAEERRGRTGEALAISESAQHELMRQLAPLVVKQYSPEDIERTAATASSVLSSTMKRSEDVLTSLARVAPAVGLVGTTLGLITLLKDLRNFDRLGPSMALALLCTLSRRWRRPASSRAR